VNNDVDKNEFARIFRENIQKRSRTAKGVSDTSSSTGKRKLALEGEALVAQVDTNTTNLIDFVWELREAGLVFPYPRNIRFMKEGFHDIINCNLQLPDAYKKEHELLEREALVLSKKSGRKCRINHRYRVWSVSYTTKIIPPLELEFAMDAFYEELGRRIREAKKGRISQEELLAWVDHTIDEEIHPWLDGCGRNATAMIMWISIFVPGFRLPVFGETKKEHYRRIRDLAGHTEYFRECLSR